MCIYLINCKSFVTTVKLLQQEQAKIAADCKSNPKKVLELHK